MQYLVKSIPKLNMEHYLGQVGTLLELLPPNTYMLRMPDGFNRYFYKENLIEIKGGVSLKFKIGDTLEIVRSDYPALEKYIGKKAKVCNISRGMYRLDGIDDVPGVAALWSEHEVKSAKPKQYALYDETDGFFAVNHITTDHQYFSKWLNKNAKSDHKYTLLEIGERFPAKTETKYVLEGI